MLCFTKSKVNLGLRILRKRPDGYHDIESVFIPINWNDAIEVICHEKISQTSFHFYGINIPGIHENHTLKKVINLLDLQYDIQIPPSEIHVLKNIPAGAGVGGGSGNAAAFLNLVCDKYALSLSFEQKFNLLKSVGSDCPFFLYDKPCLIQGTGDQIKPIEIPQLKNLYILAIWPGIHSDTAKAYKNCNPHETGPLLNECVHQPLSEWKNFIFNDFEKTVFKDYPELGTIKKQMYNSGAVYASMSGSGSTIYGLFENKPNKEFLKIKDNYRHYLGKL
jgi:4-diphosphocytidyl-2-C-methyl-D-erythritol kinase